MKHHDPQDWGDEVDAGGCLTICLIFLGFASALAITIFLF